MPFRSSLILRKVNSELWSLTRPLHYRGRDQGFTVPEGFYTDFATVPGIMTWLVPKTGKYTEAAVLHDYLCTRGIELGLVSSRDADGIFRRTMRELGVGPVRRWLMWAGVRWGAVANPVRRPGVWMDLPRMMVISIVVAPVLVLPVLTILLALAVYAVTEALAVTLSRGRAMLRS